MTDKKPFEVKLLTRLLKISKKLTEITSNFWSSTENSDKSSNAWYVNLPNGNTNNDDKSNEGNNAVRCVRRDLRAGSWLIGCSLVLVILSVSPL